MLEREREHDAEYLDGFWRAHGVLEPTAQSQNQSTHEWSTSQFGWPEPVPLPTGLPAVASFQIALMPESLQPWVRDTCDLMQCPPDFVGVATMTALGR